MYFTGEKGIRMLQVDPRHKRLQLLGVAVLGTALLSACGSDSKTATPATSSSSSSSGSSSSGSSGSASSGSASSSEVQAAGKAIEPYLKVPEKINQSEPLKAKLPTDKTWVIITCQLPQCKLISDGALDAAKTAGVPTKLLSYQTTDGTTLTNAMKQALDAKPFAVSPIGFSQTLWDGLQPQYKAAGVSITPIALGDTKTSEVVTEGSASQVDYGADGGRMANYVIKDSSAAAHVLVMDVPAFAVLKAYGEGFKEVMAKGCSACKVTPLDLAPAQLASNGVVPAVVSALQKDKSVKYLAATDGAFLVGINPALTAAGLSDIKILGGSPDINNLNALKQGTQTAWTAAAEDQYGWVALDIIGRKLNGQQIPPADGGRVSMIATKDNVGTPSPTGLGAPKDYRDQYKKLWGLS